MQLTAKSKRRRKFLPVVDLLASDPHFSALRVAAFQTKTIVEISTLILENSTVTVKDRGAWKIAGVITDLPNAFLYDICTFGCWATVKTWRVVTFTF
jgi:hypothetical protein